MTKHASSTSDKKRHLTFFVLPCFVISCLLTATSSIAWASTENEYQNRTHGHTGGGFEIFTGRTEDGGSITQYQTDLHASSVTSMGNIQLQAGNRYQQVGSDVLAKGDIDVSARSIDILAAQNQSFSASQQQQQSKGMTGGLGSNAEAALHKASRAAQRLGESEALRTRFMDAANTAMHAYQAAQTIQSGNISPTVKIAYAEEKASSEAEENTRALRISNMLGRGKVRLNASGGNNANIHISGADVLGTGGTHLKADGAINITAAQYGHEKSGIQRQSGWKAGVAISADQGVAIGVLAGGHYGKGELAESGKNWRTARIGHHDSATSLQSASTLIQGGQITGKGIALDTGKLTVNTLQNHSSHHSRDYHSGGEIVVGWGFASGNASHENSKLDHEHNAVNDISGLFAGSDGYQINVTGHTHLGGGLITSAPEAEAEGKNRFATQSISWNDLDNHSQHKGRAFGLSVAFDSNGNNAVSPAGAFEQNRDSRSSATRAGISTQNLVITDGRQQQAASGHSTADSLAALKSGIHTASPQEAARQNGALADTFDPGKTNKELRLAREAAMEFGRNAPQAVSLAAEKLGNLSQHKWMLAQQRRDEAQLARETDPAIREALRKSIAERGEAIAANQSAYDNWKEGGAARNILHAITGAVGSGNLSGAAASYTTSALSPELNRLNNPFINLAGGAAIGALTGAGNPSAAFAGMHTDHYNRQLHPTERQIIERLAKELAEKAPEGISLTESEWNTRLTLVANAMVDKRNHDILLRELSRSGWQSGSKGYLGNKYLHSIEIAQKTLQTENQKQQKLTWQNGNPIRAHGDHVYAFGATTAQYQDHNLFGNTQPASHVYRIGKKSVESYIKHQFDDIYGQGSNEHRNEIISFDFASQRGLNQQQQLEKDYSRYSGTGEVYSVYPEDLLLSVPGLLKKGLKSTGNAKNITHQVDNLSGKLADDFANARKLDEEISALRKIGEIHRNQRTPNFTWIENNTIRHVQDIRVKEIAHQFNSKAIAPKDMTLTINGKTYSANPVTSINAPVYQGVSESNVIAYFKELTGTSQLPPPKIMAGKQALDGSPARVWTVKPAEGPLQGNTVNLRSYSSSQKETSARFTIEIRKGDGDLSGIKAGRVEIKFE